MDLNENQKKIYDLFNLMQKSIINFPILTCPYKSLAFNYYKIHVATLNNFLKNNLIGTLSLKVFGELFEGENNFKKYEKEKADFIYILIENIKCENKIIAQSNIDKKIGQMLKEEKCPELRKLIKILKSNANIRAELYYLLLIYLKERGFKVTDLIENLGLILNEKYPDFIFELTNIDNNDITFNELINELSATIGDKMLDNFTRIQFDKKSKKITYNGLSVEDIYNIIQSTSDKNEIKNNNANNNNSKNKKNKKKKNKQKISNDKSNTIIEINDKIIQKKEDENFNSKEYTNEIHKINNDDKQNKQNSVLENINKAEKEIALKKIKKKEESNLERKIEELNEKINNLNKKYDQIKLENEEIKQENLDHKKKIIKLEFELKIIGLRSAFKTLIDLFIYIFGCNECGNLKRKRDTLNNIFCNKNNYDKNDPNKIKNFINDIDYVIDTANIKAHFINTKNNLFDELYKNLSNYLEDDKAINTYKNIICLLKELNVEEDLKDLVVLRNRKFKIKNYEEEEKKIIEKIKNNPLIKDGKASQKLMCPYKIKVH